MHFPSQLAKAKQPIATYPDKKDIYNKHNLTTFYMVKINIWLNYLLPHKEKKTKVRKITTEKEKLELITQSNFFLRDCKCRGRLIRKNH